MGIYQRIIDGTYQRNKEKQLTQSVGRVSRQSGDNHSRDLLPRWTAEDHAMEEEAYQYTPELYRLNYYQNNVLTSVKLK